MTVDTVRGQFIATRRCGTMQAAVVRYSLWPVAAAAIDVFQFLSVSPSSGTGQVTVTFDALCFGMNRCCVRGFIDVGRYLAISTIGSEFRVVVAPEALLVILRRCLRRRESEYRGCC